MKTAASQPPAHGKPRVVEIAADGVRAPRARSRMARFCEKILREAGHSSWRVGILLCGDARIAALNRRYRNQAVATDVLSFPEEDGRKSDPVEGDIAISLDALGRNARQFDLTENEEMKRLLTHGLLHLAGMEHGSGRGGVMLDLQEKLLDTFRSEWIYGEKGT
jgi:probable rRNA maturation factor